jgi:hypothetical protein
VVGRLEARVRRGYEAEKHLTIICSRRSGLGPGPLLRQNVI